MATRSLPNLVLRMRREPQCSVQVLRVLVQRIGCSAQTSAQPTASNHLTLAYSAYLAARPSTHRQLLNSSVAIAGPLTAISSANTGCDHNIHIYNSSSCGALQPALNEERSSASTATLTLEAAEASWAVNKKPVGRGGRCQGPWHGAQLTSRQGQASPQPLQGEELCRRSSAAT